MLAPVPSQPEADRNLLFGILALQLDFISRDALIAGMSAWVLNKAKPLGQILQDQGELHQDARGLLEALVQKHLEMHGGDPAQSLAAAGPSSVAQELGRVPDPDLQASLAHTTAFPELSEDPFGTTVPAVGAPTSSGQRFRILRPHARGGLGVVFLAHDEELRREVALKEIQERHADRPDSRSRFLLEAEITGALEHPGVVPVYGLGHHPDGRPYYAMRFVRGESLKDALVRFHRADVPGRDPGERTLALRELLGRFLAVCNTLAYAHSRGVLHRDLKPGNVMLGPYGETLGVDWGLAKAVGRPEGMPSSGERTLHPAENGSPPTQTGQIVGTPQFMSPEQAAGQLAELGPASDVYSLGATLYCLLTGRAPCDGESTEQVLSKVTRGDFPPPRQVKRSVPLALEAVCLKAMALRPSDRYPSARALADDVEHWLADEPVSAYREPWPGRAARWARRHRAGVMAAVASLAVAVACLAVATGLLTVAGGRERAARLLAEQQRDRARARFQMAQDSVSRYADLSESPELQAHDLEKLRAELLETALGFYQGLVREDSEDLDVRAQQGRAYRRLASLYAATGRGDRAEAAFRKAVEVQRKLAEAQPQVPDHGRDLTRSLTDRSDFLAERGRGDEATASLRDAVAVARRLAKSNPGVPAYQEQLARCQLKLGNHYYSTDDNGRAEAELVQGRDILEQLTRTHPEVPEYQQDLAWALALLGPVYEETNRKDLAEGGYRQALAALKKLAARDAGEANQSLLAGTYVRLANLYRQTGRHQETEEAGKEALAIRKKLAEAHPRLPQYQHELAHAYDTLGLFYSALRRTERAEACFQEALAIWKKLAEAHPEVLSYHGQLAQVYYTLGDCPSNDCRLFYQEGEPAEQGQRELAETVVCSERQVR